jgi:phage virion morphogenesis protein
MNELHALESWAGALLAKLQPPARRAVLRDIARELRRSQRARIAQQRNPDGSAYTPRKVRTTTTLRSKRSRIKRAAMFTKLRTARYLREESNANEAVIGFTGRVARIARVHQFGERERVALRGPEYQYPARTLLGFTPTDRQMIRDKLLAHLL